MRKSPVHFIEQEDFHFAADRCVGRPSKGGGNEKAQFIEWFCNPAFKERYGRSEQKRRYIQRHPLYTVGKRSRI